MTDELKAILETVVFIKDNAASKEDLVNFATKDDLKNFATKDDLKNFATKDDLKFVASKHDLEKFLTKDEYQQGQNEVLNKMDGFIQLHQKVDLELTALRGKYQRLEDILNKVLKHLNLELD